jgi:hypothetical protein
LAAEDEHYLQNKELKKTKKKLKKRKRIYEKWHENAREDIRKISAEFAAQKMNREVKHDAEEHEESLRRSQDEISADKMNNQILQDYHEDLAADNQIRSSNLIARTKNHVKQINLHKNNLRRSSEEIAAAKMNAMVLHDAKDYEFHLQEKSIESKNEEFKKRQDDHENKAIELNQKIDDHKLDLKKHENDVEKHIKKVKKHLTMIAEEKEVLQEKSDTLENDITNFHGVKSSVITEYDNLANKYYKKSIQLRDKTKAHKEAVKADFANINKMNQNIMNVDKNVRHIGKKVRAEIVKLEAKQQKFETMLLRHENINQQQNDEIRKQMNHLEHQKRSLDLKLGTLAKSKELHETAKLLLKNKKENHAKTVRLFHNDAKNDKKRLKKMQQKHNRNVKISYTEWNEKMRDHSVFPIWVQFLCPLVSY